MSDTVTIRYDRAGKLYYVDRLRFHRPTTWLALERGDDGKYAAYPFAFYEIKSGREEQVPADHELVQRYAQGEGWPEPGSLEYGVQLTRYLKNMRDQRASHEKSIAFFDREIAMCEALDARHLEIAEGTK